MRWRRKRTGDDAADGGLRFDELGSLQFERLCAEVLSLSCGLESAEWYAAPFGRVHVVGEGIALPRRERELPGPTLALIVWLKPGGESRQAARRLQGIVAEELREWSRADPRSVLVLANVACSGADFAGVEAAWLGPSELGALVRSSGELRWRVPTVLGIGSSADLLAPEAVARSSMDMQAALQLARVFVPTHAYDAALAVLKRHHFSALIGPPEMGKTAIAQMIGLAALSDGREVHECNRPDELWARYARARQQVFIADDAFGSTEYRPEAAERWALELDRVLRAMDEHHWLVWTSRPAPLKAGLRRIHREHGVERFPQPSEVQVDAASLEVTEKALILFRHAKSADLPGSAIELVQAEGWSIVSHPHFTPERIRRFVGGRLLELTQPGGSGDVEQKVADEIREPTAAMVASFRALSEEHRTLLVALLDTPPGPVPLTQVTEAFRRHAVGGLRTHPPDIIDRLTDHFLRLVDNSRVSWVHPSWRDLVIEELRTDREGRKRFLGACSLEGILLAISTAGGSSGERSLPLLAEDLDWDALTNRLATLVPELDEPDISRLLLTLGETRRTTAEVGRSEIEALATYALQLLTQRWNGERAAVPVGLLASWFDLAARLRERPNQPELGSTWISLLPTERVDLDASSDVSRFDDWTALCEFLHEHASELLRTFGFPGRQGEIIRTFVTDVEWVASAISIDARRDSIVRILRRLSHLAADYADSARRVANQLAAVPEDSELPETYTPRPISRELRRILDMPLTSEHSDEDLVARVLADL